MAKSIQCTYIEPHGRKRTQFKKTLRYWRFFFSVVQDFKFMERKIAVIFMNNKQRLDYRIRSSDG